MSIDFALLSERGPRSENQDSVAAFIRDDGSFLACVADGLGGHRGGKRASETVVEELKKSGAQIDFIDTFQIIHEKLLSLQKGNEELSGMATTATAVKIDGYKMIGGHCGDTRCSILRGNGILKLTTEHTEAQRLFHAGKLTKGEFLNYPRRNILDRALGSSKTPEVDIFSFDLEVGDRILITSDGVHEKIRQREMLEILRGVATASDISSVIGEHILKMEAEDNYSVVVLVVS